MRAPRSSGARLSAVSEHRVGCPTAIVGAALLSRTNNSRRFSPTKDRSALRKTSTRSLLRRPPVRASTSNVIVAPEAGPGRQEVVRSAAFHALAGDHPDGGGASGMCSRCPPLPNVSPLPFPNAFPIAFPNAARPASGRCPSTCCATRRHRWSAGSSQEPIDRGASSACQLCRKAPLAVGKARPKSTTTGWGGRVRHRLRARRARDRAAPGRRRVRSRVVWGPRASRWCASGAAPCHAGLPAGRTTHRGTGAWRRSRRRGWRACAPSGR